MRELTEAAGKPVAGLRVGVKNGGCAGMSYTMELAEATNPTDEIVEDKGVRLLIDPKAVLFLLGSQMDFKVDRLSATFAFSNPNGSRPAAAAKRRDHPSEPRGASRAGLISLDARGRRGPEGAVRAFWSVTVKRMFGGSGIYAEGLCFAIELKGEVFLKTDAVSQPDFSAVGSTPFVYVAKGQARPTSYWSLPAAAMKTATSYVAGRAPGSRRRVARPTPRRSREGEAEEGQGLTLLDGFRSDAGCKFSSRRPARLAKSSAMVAVLLDELDAEPAPVDAVAADQSVR